MNVEYLGIPIFHIGDSMQLSENQQKQHILCISTTSIPTPTYCVHFRMNRASASGMLPPDCCFMECWGYPLGDRDRRGSRTMKWNPANAGRFFRSKSSFKSSSLSMGSDSTNGVIFGSSSQNGWDSWDHSSKRESAKLSNSVHRMGERGRDYPFVDCQFRPSAIYTLKYKQNGLKT